MPETVCIAMLHLLHLFICRLYKLIIRSINRRSNRFRLGRLSGSPPYARTTTRTYEKLQLDILVYQ
jgi:hypothetical protein